MQTVYSVHDETMSFSSVAKGTANGMIMVVLHVASDDSNEDESSKWNSRNPEIRLANSGNFPISRV